LSRLVLINLPGASWKSIVSDEASKQLPTFLNLIEKGTSGPLSTVGPQAIVDGIILTGQHPAESGFLANRLPRLDGFGVDVTSAFHLKCKVLSQYLDDHGIQSASVNMRASQYLTLDSGLVVSDVFSEIRREGYSNWGIPVGSLSPVTASDQLFDFRIHPEELHPEQIDYFVPSDRRGITEEKIKVIAKFLAETSSTHAIATHLLAKSEYQLVSVSYPALDDLSHHFNGTEKSVVGFGASWKFLIFLDSMISRIVSLLDVGDCIFVVGGKSAQPFWIAKGRNFPVDRLFSSEVSLYDIVPSILAHFGLEVTGLPGKSRTTNSIGKLHRKAYSPVEKTFQPLDFLDRFPPPKIANLEPTAEQSIALRRAEFRSHYNLAEVYRIEGSIKLAIEECRKALELFADDSLCLLRISSMLLDLGKVKQARNFLEKINKNLPSVFAQLILDVYIALGEGSLSYASLKSFKIEKVVSTEEELETLIKLHKDIARIFKDRKLTLQSEEHLQAIERLLN
jgi:tetratricopeptide (TPR) repeat protein